MIHRVDNRFFIADDGRIIFRAGRQFVVIPESDLGLVRRRNMQANTVGILAVIVSNIGWPQAYWRPWWLAVGIAVWVVAYLWAGRWARERYSAATDPMTAREVRTAIYRADPRSVGSEVMSSVLGLISAVLALGNHAPRSPWTLLLILALGHFFGAFWRLRRPNEAGAESYEGRTK